jgi:hypothetical protein
MRGRFTRQAEKEVTALKEKLEVTERKAKDAADDRSRGRG